MGKGLGQKDFRVTHKPYAYIDSMTVDRKSTTRRVVGNAIYNPLAVRNLFVENLARVLLPVLRLLNSTFCSF